MSLPKAVTKLLPTPCASDATGGGAHPDTRVGHTRQLIDFALLDGSPRWAEYGAAIEAWEQVTGRQAPAATEIGRRGNPRLNIEFSEWMMGWPAGWVSDFVNRGTKRPSQDEISRTQALRMIGNGVCPQQAALAIRQLLDLTHNDQEA